MTDGLGLEGAYSATLSRIKGQGGEKARLGMAALMWISHSERPLEADELCHALAVEIGSSNFNSGNIPSIRTLLACCQGLVAVDKETSTIRLIHFTLQEHLRAQPELFVTAHSTMAETCLSYLNSHQVKALSASPSPDPPYTPLLHYFSRYIPLPPYSPQDMPFLQYSSLYWGTHARRDLSDCAKALALQLFGDYNNHISTRILLNEKFMLPVGLNEPPLFSGLHCASVFGIVEIVDILVEVEGYNINQEDCVGNTPLLWAASGGHEGVVKVLLERDDVDPNKPDNDGRTPPCSAARSGHQGVVKILLERTDINPNKLETDGQTPLCCAGENGHEGVAKMPLERDDVNPDKPDDQGRTPLWWAAKNGHKGVVKILLERRGVNPDKPDSGGQTPLSCAASSGHEGVVQMLLGCHNVNLDKPDNDGKTPL